LHWSRTVKFREVASGRRCRLLSQSSASPARLVPVPAGASAIAILWFRALPVAACVFAQSQCSTDFNLLLSASGTALCEDEGRSSSSKTNGRLFGGLSLCWSLDIRRGRFTSDPIR